MMMMMTTTTTTTTTTMTMMMMMMMMMMIIVIIIVIKTLVEPTHLPSPAMLSSYHPSCYSPALPRSPLSLVAAGHNNCT
jgi:hypothetical protein